jgi:hypothetical protein
MAEPSATSTTRCTQTTGVGVVHVELWAKLAGGAVRFRVANVRPVQSYRTHADRSWTWRARERFVCASSNSPRGGQICYRELLTRTFRKGMGLGVESEAVANAGHVLESVQSKVSVWYTVPSVGYREVEAGVPEKRLQSALQVLQVAPSPAITPS